MFCQVHEQAPGLEWEKDVSLPRVPQGVVVPPFSSGSHFPGLLLSCGLASQTLVSHGKPLSSRMRLVLPRTFNGEGGSTLFCGFQVRWQMLLCVRAFVCLDVLDWFVWFLLNISLTANPSLHFLKNVTWAIRRERGYFQNHKSASWFQQKGLNIWIPKNTSKE